MISQGQQLVEVETIVDKKYGGFSTHQVRLLEVWKTSTGFYCVCVDGDWVSAVAPEGQLRLQCKVYEKEENKEEVNT